MNRMECPWKGMSENGSRPGLSLQAIDGHTSLDAVFYARATCLIAVNRLFRRAYIHLTSLDLVLFSSGSSVGARGRRPQIRWHVRGSIRSDIGIDRMRINAIIPIS